MAAMTWLRPGGGEEEKEEEVEMEDEGLGSNLLT